MTTEGFITFMPDVWVSNQSLVEVGPGRNLLAMSGPLNEEKTAASVCLQVAAWLPDIFCSFYLAKNYEIAKNSMTTREKISTDLES
jgi:hypothetical protein